MLIICVIKEVSSISYFSGIHLLFFVWLISTLVSYGQKASSILLERKYIYFYVFLCFYFTSMFVATDFATAFARTVAMMEMMAPIYMYDLYKIDKWGGRKYPFWVLVIVLIINMSLSFAMIEIMGDTGLRQTIQGDSENLFKGAFSIVYSLAIIVPCVVYAIKHMYAIRLKKSRSLLLIVMMAVFGIYATILVFKAYFITALIVLIVGSLLAFIYGKRYWVLKSLLVTGLFVLLFLSNFNAIVSTVDNISYGASKQITPKLYELRSFFLGDVHEAYDMSSRNNLAESSLNTFLQHPVFGVSYMAKDFSETSKIGIGNHSEWLDSLALYGFFSIFLFLFLFYATRQQIKGIGFALSFFLFFFIGINNPILSFTMMSTVYLLIPVFFDMIKLSKL